jgi:hypothetical protein
MIMKPHPQTLIKSSAGSELLQIGNFGTMNVTPYNNNLYIPNAISYMATIQLVVAPILYPRKHLIGGSTKKVAVTNINLSPLPGDAVWTQNSGEFYIALATITGSTASQYGIPLDSDDPASEASIAASQPTGLSIVGKIFQSYIISLSVENGLTHGGRDIVRSGKPIILNNQNEALEFGIPSASRRTIEITIHWIEY